MSVRPRRGARAPAPRHARGRRRRGAALRRARRLGQPPGGRARGAAGRRAVRRGRRRGARAGRSRGAATRRWGSPAARTCAWSRRSRRTSGSGRARSWRSRWRRRWPRCTGGRSMRRGWPRRSGARRARRWARGRSRSGASSSRAACGAARSGRRRCWRATRCPRSGASSSSSRAPSRGCRAPPRRRRSGGWCPRPSDRRRSRSSCSRRCCRRSSSAIVEEFGAALTRIQQLVGDAFATVQGGRFHPRAGALVDALLGGGAAGAGQSSWGPAVYGVVGSEAAGRALARRMEDVIDGEGSVRVVTFDNRGARVEAVMKLLVSVVDAGEARAAAAAGADIVDVKNPAEGSLGAPSPAVIAAVRAAVSAELPVSAAIGDMPNLPGTAALAALGAARSGATFVKLGLWGVSTEDEAVALLRAVRDGVADVPGTVVVAARLRGRPARGARAARARAAAARGARGGRPGLPARHGRQGRPRAAGMALARRARRRWWPRRMPRDWRWRWPARCARRTCRWSAAPAPTSPASARPPAATAGAPGPLDPERVRALRAACAATPRGVSMSPATCSRWAHLRALRSRMAAGTASPQAAAASAACVQQVVEDAPERAGSRSGSAGRSRRASARRARRARRPRAPRAGRRRPDRRAARAARRRRRPPRAACGRG